jgi:hypothetical protein
MVSKFQKPRSYDDLKLQNKRVWTVSLASAPRDQLAACPKCVPVDCLRRYNCTLAYYVELENKHEKHDWPASFARCSPKKRAIETN